MRERKRSTSAVDSGHPNKGPRQSARQLKQAPIRLAPAPKLFELMAKISQ